MCSRFLPRILTHIVLDAPDRLLPDSNGALGAARCGTVPLHVKMATGQSTSSSVPRSGIGRLKRHLRKCLFPATQFDAWAGSCGRSSAKALIAYGRKRFRQCSLIEKLFIHLLSKDIHISHNLSYVTSGHLLQPNWKTMASCPRRTLLT